MQRALKQWGDNTRTQTVCSLARENATRKKTHNAFLKGAREGGRNAAAEAGAKVSVDKGQQKKEKEVTSSWGGREGKKATTELEANQPIQAQKEWGAWSRHLCTHA